MAEKTLHQNSLVLYKNRPAMIKQTGDKLEIELDDSRRFKVRPKDVVPLHPGPIHTMADLRKPEGDIKTAWELLSGSTTTLAELAELIYGTYSPATAWAAWQLVADGLYFRGMPESITAALPEEVAQIETARQAKATEEQSWQEFLNRARAGQVEPADHRYLREVELLALGQTNRSRILRELNYSESPESAHAFLLKLGYWDEMVVPYPQRLALPTTSPAIELPPLPEEPRLDLTHLPAFAIDDEGSRDPDDALSLEGNRLWVHVADAAAIIRPDSPLDLEARARGANLYLPDQVIHMLPPQTSEMFALGLQPTSPALSFGLDLGPEGEVIHIELVLSWIRVQRLTYETVEKQLDQEPFKRLYGLARGFQERRRANGGIFIDLPEVKIRVENGQVTIRPLLPLKSRDLVQEAMLVAGEAVARFAVSNQVVLPFTIQDLPLEGGFSDTLSGMFARRRTLKRGQLTTIPAPNSGLGLEIYSKVTSPLRRYSDLVAHQQLRAYLRDEPLLDTSEILERLGAAEAMVGTVTQAERLARKHWTLVYLRRHPDWRGQAILVEKRGLRGLVIIPELDLEAYVYLPDELPLDSVLSLALSRIDLAELEAHFRVQEYMLSDH
jgi:exoribonuclease-2